MKRFHWLVLAASAAVLSVAAPAQAQPTSSAQALQAELAGMPDQETLVLRVEFAPGKGTGWHTHPDGHEILYVLEGVWTAEADGREIKKLAAGDSIYVPPNVVHRATNEGTTPVKLLVVRIKPKGKPVTTPFNR